VNVVAKRKVVGVAVLAAECRAVRSIEKFSAAFRQARAATSQLTGFAVAGSLGLEYASPMIFPGESTRGKR
jgi:hypothetical protein